MSSSSLMHRLCNTILGLNDLLVPKNPSCPAPLLHFYFSLGVISKLLLISWECRVRQRFELLKEVGGFDDSSFCCSPKVLIAVSYDT